MKDYLEHFLQNPLYFIVILIAFLSGGAAYYFSQRTKRGTKLAAFTLTSVLSLALSTSICLAVSAVFSKQKPAYRSFFSLYYYIISFAVISSFINKLIVIDFNLDDFTKPLLVNVCVARTACMIEGCCGGILPFSYIECLLSLLLLLYSLIWKAPFFYTFLTGYSIYRFISEFFKDTFLLERLGPLTVMQYVSLLAITFSTVIIIKKKERRENL